MGITQRISRTAVFLCGMCNFYAHASVSDGQDDTATNITVTIEKMHEFGPLVNSTDGMAPSDHLRNFLLVADIDGGPSKIDKCCNIKTNDWLDCKATEELE